MAANSDSPAWIRTDADQKSELSAFLRLVLGLFFDNRERHGLLEGLTHLLQAFLVHIMNALATLGRKVDQLVITHGAALPGEK